MQRANSLLHSRGVRIVTVIVLLTVVVGTVATPVGAQSSDTTTVAVAPQEQTVSADDTVTYDIIVDAAPDGVSAYAYTVSIDETTATITDVQFGGSADASTRNLNYSADNSSVAVTAGLSDIDAGENVTIGTITLTGVSEGSTQIGLDVTTLLDTTNSEMNVSATQAGTLTVTSGGADGGTDEPTTDEPATNDTQLTNETTDSDAELDDAESSETNETTNATEGTDTTDSAESESDTDGDGGGGITDSVPGFGVVVSIVSLLAVGVLFGRTH